MKTIQQNLDNWDMQDLDFGHKFRNLKQLAFNLDEQLRNCIGSLEALERFAPGLCGDLGYDMEDEEWIQIAINRKNDAAKLLEEIK